MPVLFQIKIEIWTRTEFKDGTKAVMVYFNSVILFYNSPVIEIFMDFIFSYCMFYIIVFDLFRPAIVKMMNLAGYLSTMLKVESLVHF